MPLSDINNDLDQCERHLEKTDAMGTRIESYLMRFLLVRICGEFEKEIGRIMKARIHECKCAWGEPRDDVR